MSPSETVAYPPRLAGRPVHVTREPLLGAADALVARFGASSWPALTVGWALSWAQSCPELIEVEALVARRDGVIVGFALLYRVLRLELLRYLGPGGIRLSNWLRARWRDPVTLRIAYVDLPYTDEESVALVPEEAEPDAVREALVRAAIDDPRSHAVCVRTNVGGPLDAAADWMALSTVPMPRRHVAVARRRLRRLAREPLEHWQGPATKGFAHAGRAAVASCASSTRARTRRASWRCTGRRSISVVGKGGIEVPVQMREPFFAGLYALPEPTRGVIAAEVDGRIVAALLVLIAPAIGCSSALCGLDYQVSPQTRAYFCLWPEIIALAGEHGCKRVIFGSEAYENKLRLGAVKVPTRFRVAFVSCPLRLVARPLTAALSESFEGGAALPEGATMRERETTDARMGDARRGDLRSTRARWRASGASIPVSWRRSSACRGSQGPSGSSANLHAPNAAGR